MDDAMPAPGPAPDLIGTGVLSLEEEEEEDVSLWIAASPVGVPNPQPLSDGTSPRSRAFASLMPRNEPREELCRLGSSFCSAILPRSGSPQFLAAFTSPTPFDFGELDLSSHLTFQPFLGLPPPPPSPPSLFAGIDTDEIAANWQATAARTLVFEKPTEILSRQLRSMFLNFEKFEIQTDTWGSRPGRIQSPFPSTYRGANFHPTEHRRDFGGSVSQQNRRLLLGSPLGTVSYAESPQSNVPDTDVPRSLLLASANNFAGLEDVDISKIIPWISRSKNGSLLIQQLLRDKQNPHVRAMAENLLKASVEAQSVTAFRQILASGAVDIDAVVCCVDGGRYTVLERSAALQNLSLVRAALDIRPKIEEPVGVRASDRSRPLSAFACLVGSLGRHDVSISSDFEKIANLLHRAGAYIHVFLLCRLMTHGKAGIRLALSLASKVAPMRHRELISVGFLHDSIRGFQNEAMALNFVKGIFNVCYDEHRWACKHDAVTRRMLSRVFVTSAEAGYFNLVKLLLPFKDEGESSFLLASIHGGSKDVVSLALSLKPDLGGQEGAATLAEAIRSRREDLIRLLEEAGCLKYLQTGHHFELVITAASETGNLIYVQKLLQHRPRPCLSDISGALEASVEAGHDEIASALAAAISGGDLLMAAALRHDWPMVYAILDHGPNHQHPLRHYELLVEWQRATLRSPSRRSPLRAPFRRVTSPWDGLFAHLVGGGDHQIISKAIKLFPVKTNKDTHWEVPWAKLNREVLPFLCKHKVVSRRGLTFYLQQALEKQDDGMVDLAIRLGANPVNGRVLELAVTHSRHLLPFILSQVPRQVLEFVALDNEHRLNQLDAQDPPYQSPDESTTWAAIQSALGQGVSGLPSLKSLFESGIVYMPTLHMWLKRGATMDCIIDLRKAIIAIEGDHDNFAVVRYLLDIGCDPNTHEDAGQFLQGVTQLQPTALLQAVVTKHVGLVELLIQKGADVNQKTIKRSPLQEAAALGYLDIVKLLLDHGANVNAAAAAERDAEMAWRLAVGWRGGTALQLAAIGGNCAVACELLERGADLHMAPCKYKGRWPLEGAAEYGRMSMVELLWEYGSGNFPDSVVDRAMELAEQNGHLACKELLGSLRAKKRQFGDAGLDWMAPVF